jgi:DNA-binding NarL/FixJ family response regulator
VKSVRAVEGYIRVVLVDDHAIERQGLRALINESPDMEVISEAADGLEALDLLGSADPGPDVVIIETSMPRMNGLELAGRIRRGYPEMKVVVLTRHERTDFLLAVVRAGVSAYLPKTVSSEELLDAIRTVCAGGRVLEPRALDVVLRDYSHRWQAAEGGAATDLTAREREVLTLVAEGHSNKEIADLLRLSHKTVESHRHNLMVKLDFHSAADLVKHAVREGMVILDPV